MFYTNKYLLLHKILSFMNKPLHKKFGYYWIKTINPFTFQVCFFRLMYLFVVMILNQINQKESARQTNIFKCKNNRYQYNCQQMYDYILLRINNAILKIIMFLYPEQM